MFCKSFHTFHSSQINTLKVVKNIVNINIWLRGHLLIFKNLFYCIPHRWGSHVRRSLCQYRIYKLTSRERGDQYCYPEVNNVDSPPECPVEKDPDLDDTLIIPTRFPTRFQVLDNKINWADNCRRDNGHVGKQERAL